MIRDWLDENGALVTGLTLASIALLVLSALAAPILVARLPQDYLMEPSGRTRASHPLIRVARAVVGSILLLAGIAMLVLPGQGLATILIGLLLVEFPGKRALERRIVARPKLLALLNRMRERRGRPPLIVD